MELTGRSYLFAALLLLLGAGFMNVFDEQGGAPASMALVGNAKSSCLASSIRTDNTHIGCRSDISSSAGNGQMISRGTSKSIIVADQ